MYCNNKLLLPATLSAVNQDTSKNLRTRILLVAVYFLFICPLSVSADTIIIASDPWMPHTGYIEDRHGYILDIATAIFEEAGHEVEYVVQPWSRAIVETRDGKVNAIAACFKEEAEDFIYPEVSIGITRSVFYINNSIDWEYTGVESLDSITLGVVKDYSYGEEIDVYLEENKWNRDLVHYSYGDEPQTKMIEMLTRGRLDAIYVDQAVAKYLLKKMAFREDSIKLSTDMGPDELWIGFSPSVEKSSEYAQILSDGIVRFKENGKMAQILSSYGLSMF